MALRGAFHLCVDAKIEHQVLEESIAASSVRFLAFIRLLLCDSKNSKGLREFKHSREFLLEVSKKA